MISLEVVQQEAIFYGTMKYRILPAILGAALASLFVQSPAQERAPRNVEGAQAQMRQQPCDDFLQYVVLQVPPADPLALCVPEDVAFVQFRSLSKMLEVLEAGERWSQFLFTQVDAKAPARPLKERLSKQLAVQDQPELRRLFDVVIDEVAVAASDPQLREGGDLTVLMRLKTPVLFRIRSDQFLAAAEKSRPDCRRTSGDWLGVKYVHLATPDREICVYSAYPQPGLHVRSNSKAAFQRVIEAIQGKTADGEAVRRLGDSPGFARMRSRMPRNKEEDGLVFIDPVAVRIQATPERFRFDVTAPPLHDNPLYTGLAMALGGTPEPLDLLPLPKQNLFSLNLRLDKEGLLQKLDRLEGGNYLARVEKELKRDLFGKELGIAEQELEKLQIADFVRSGIGNQIGLHVGGSDPPVDFKVAALLADAQDIEAMLNRLLPSTWNVPLCVSLPVRDARRADEFLEILDVVLEAVARKDAPLFGGKPSFTRVSVGDKVIRGVGLTTGSAERRVYFARIGDALYLANRQSILEDRPPKAPERGPEGHALLRLRPRTWGIDLTDLTATLTFRESGLHATVVLERK